MKRDRHNSAVPRGSEVAATEQRPAVAIDGMSSSYRSRGGAVQVLHGIRLCVSAGEWVAVMGPSGSGKSTLLLTAAGLLAPTGGTVEVAGTDVGSASDRSLTELRRSTVGFVFQDYNLVPALTVADNVALPTMFAGSRRDDEAVRAVLHRVGLAEHAGRRPDELSGGQRQRVAIARALFVQPRVLFADEPTGALDLAAGAGVLDSVDELVAGGAAVLMVTHDPRVAARSHRVVWLVDGRIVGESRGADSAHIASELGRLGQVPV